jgi:MFS family permease
MLESKNDMRPRFLLALSNFFAFAPYYLIGYILAPYLATFMPASTAGLAVSLGAAMTLITFPFIPRWVAKYGPQKLGIIFGCVEGIVLLLLAQNPSPLLAIFLIAVASAVAPFIVYQLDLLLEACVEDERSTGRVRTAFTTAGNCALVLSPLIVVLLLDHGNSYGRVFFVAALSILPFVLLMYSRSLPTIASQQLPSLTNAFLTFSRSRDLRAIAFSNIVLQFLFQLTPLYVSLYLHTFLGISWSSLGWVLAVSLVPYILVEYPAGWLADTKLGDKTLLATGYVIAGLAFASIGFITKSTPLIWIAALLVVLRIGGALVESMTEAHFFRRVSSQDADMVSIFRMTRPVGALTAPILGSLLLSAGTYSELFLVSGFGVLFFGLASALTIRSR